MADAIALMRVASSTTKMTNAIKDMWDERTKIRATVNDSGSLDSAIRAQVDEIFLVLAYLGEALLTLQVFNKDYYLQTLGEVHASIDSCGQHFVAMAWAELDPELQYACTAGFSFCAQFAPMHVYRGFGACVLAEWDWGCPDMAYLEEKARKKALQTVYFIKQRPPNPQPTRPAFLAFDQTIQILQVKAMAFLEKKPQISAFAEHQPRYGQRSRGEVKNELDLLEDWVKQLERRSHPVLPGSMLTSWGMPFATWNSSFSCHILKSEKDCETMMCNQMDPGRLLHAFVCCASSNLDEGQILLLPPRSPAESIMCWLEGLPGTTHKIIKWQDLDTERFEKKISKSLRKKIGRFPFLPSTSFEIQTRRTDHHLPHPHPRLLCLNILIPFHHLPIRHQDPLDQTRAHRKHHQPLTWALRTLRS